MTRELLVAVDEETIRRGCCTLAFVAVYVELTPNRLMRVPTWGRLRKKMRCRTGLRGFMPPLAPHQRLARLGHRQVPSERRSGRARWCYIEEWLPRYSPSPVEETARGGAGNWSEGRTGGSLRGFASAWSTAGGGGDYGRRYAGWPRSSGSTVPRSGSDWENSPARRWPHSGWAWVQASPQVVPFERPCVATRSAGMEREVVWGAIVARPRVLPFERSRSPWPKRPKKWTGLGAVAVPLAAPRLRRRLVAPLERTTPAAAPEHAAFLVGSRFRLLEGRCLRRRATGPCGFPWNSGCHCIPESPRLHPGVAPQPSGGGTRIGVGERSVAGRANASDVVIDLFLMKERKGVFLLVSFHWSRYPRDYGWMLGAGFLNVRMPPASA